MATAGSVPLCPHLGVGSGGGRRIHQGAGLCFPRESGVEGQEQHGHLDTLVLKTRIKGKTLTSHREQQPAAGWRAGGRAGPFPPLRPPPCVSFRPFSLPHRSHSGVLERRGGSWGGQAPELGGWLSSQTRVGGTALKPDRGFDPRAGQEPCGRPGRPDPILCPGWPCCSQDEGPCLRSRVSICPQGLQPPSAAWGTLPVTCTVP